MYQTLLSKATFTVHSGYTFFVSMCVPWELNPQPFALLTQCSTTEPQEQEYKSHDFHKHIKQQKRTRMKNVFK